MMADFAFVIDQDLPPEKSSKIEAFVELCVRAFTVIRQNHHIIINLFRLVEIGSICTNGADAFNRNPRT
jgi:hypothetical protein